MFYSQNLSLKLSLYYIKMHTAFWIQPGLSPYHTQVAKNIAVNGAVLSYSLLSLIILKQICPKNQKPRSYNRISLDVLTREQQVTPN